MPALLAAKPRAFKDRLGSGNHMLKFHLETHKLFHALETSMLQGLPSGTTAYPMHSVAYYLMTDGLPSELMDRRKQLVEGKQPYGKQAMQLFQQYYRAGSSFAAVFMAVSIPAPFCPPVERSGLHFAPT